MTVADLPDILVLRQIAGDIDEPDRRRAMAVVEMLGGAAPDDVAVWFGWPLGRAEVAIESARERGEIQDA